MRFESGTPETKDGGRIAVQVAAFVGAWRSMQGLCQAPGLLPDAMLVRTRVAERVEWRYELGLPRFALSLVFCYHIGHGWGGGCVRSVTRYLIVGAWA